MIWIRKAARFEVAISMLGAVVCAGGCAEAHRRTTAEPGATDGKVGRIPRSTGGGGGSNQGKQGRRDATEPSAVTEVGSDGDVQSEMDARVQAELDSGVYAELDSGAYAELDSGVNVNLDSGVPADAPVLSDAAASLDADAGAAADARFITATCGLNCECELDPDAVGWRNHRGTERGDWFQANETLITRSTAAHLAIVWQGASTWGPVLSVGPFGIMGVRRANQGPGLEDLAVLNPASEKVFCLIPLGKNRYMSSRPALRGALVMDPGMAYGVSDDEPLWGERQGLVAASTVVAGEFVFSLLADWVGGLEPSSIGDEDAGVAEPLPSVRGTILRTWRAQDGAPQFEPRAFACPGPGTIAVDVDNGILAASVWRCPPDPNDPSTELGGELWLFDMVTGAARHRIELPDLASGTQDFHLPGPMVFNARIGDQVRPLVGLPDKERVVRVYDLLDGQLLWYGPDDGHSHAPSDTRVTNRCAANGKHVILANPPACEPGSASCPTGTIVTAVEPSDGAEVWRSVLPERTRSHLALTPQLVLVASDQTLYVLDSETGEVLTTVDLPQDSIRFYPGAPITISAGRVYISSSQLTILSIVNR